MTLPGSAVGAGGARTLGVNEFGPVGLMVGSALLVGDGAGELGDGAGELELVVGAVVSEGFSLLEVQPLARAAIPTTAHPPNNSPI